jgi:hypothetical protein
MSPTLLLALFAISAPSVETRFAWPRQIPWVLYAPTGSTRFGATVRGVGDIDRDGFEDLVVASNLNSSGEVSLFLGSSFGPAPFPAWTLQGNTPNSALGTHMAPAADFDGDGFGDIILGAPGDSTGAPDGGLAILVFGAPEGIADRPAWAYEGRSAGGRLGTAVAGLGDIDGDGLSDIAIGCPGHAPTAPVIDATGRVELFRGRATGPAAQPTWTLDAPALSTSFGRDIAPLGDLDNDTFADFAITSDQAVHLYLGSPAGPVPLGPPISAKFIAGPGDLDGDASPDLVVGTENRLFVVSLGPDGLGPPRDLDLPSNSTLLRAPEALGDMNGDGYADFGVQLFQPDSTTELLLFTGHPARPALSARWPLPPGASFGTTGDLDGDGYADLAIGRPDLPQNGQAMIIRGAGTGPAILSEPLPIDFPFADSVRLSTLGDTNSDGYDDLAIGVVDTAQSTQKGEVAIVLGGHPSRQLLPTRISHEKSGIAFGKSISGPGDVDGDGYADLAIGAPLLKTAASLRPSGEVWLVYGNAQGPGQFTDEKPTQRFRISAQYSSGYGLPPLGDFDGDGRADLAVIGSNENYDERVAAIALGGDVMPGRVIDFADMNREFTENAARGDFDNDGFLDVVFGGTSTRNPVMAFGSRGNPYIDYLSLPIDSDEGCIAYGVGDLDGNAHADVLLVPKTPCTPLAPLPFFVLDGVDLFPTPYDILQNSVSWPSTCKSPTFIAAGDIDADGHADVAMVTDKSRIDIFPGAHFGLDLDAISTLSQPSPSAFAVVSEGGDFDGDGFSDLPFLTLAETRAELQIAWGNSALGTTSAFPYAPTARQPLDEGPISVGGRSRARDSVSFAVSARSPFGRGALSLEVEVKPSHIDFDGQGTFLSVEPLRPEPGQSRRLWTRVTGLASDTAYHWRARVLYDRTSPSPQAWSRWLTGGLAGQPHRVHFRTAPNLAPVLVEDLYAVGSDELLLIPVGTGVLSNDSDPDGDPLTASVYRPPRHGILTLLPTGAFSYAPDKGFIGLDSFEYEARDKEGAVTRGNVRLTVSPNAVCGEVSESLCELGRFFIEVRLTNGEIRSVHCWLDALGVPDCKKAPDGTLELALPVCSPD